MRLQIVIVALLLMRASAFAQGWVLFLNKGLEPSVAPVTLSDGTGPGETMVAGLYVVSHGELQLIKTTPFRTNTLEGRRFLVQTDAQVPGIAGGEAAVFRVRVWETRSGSFEKAVATGAAHGEFSTVSGNGEIFIEHLGDTDPRTGFPVDPPFLNGLLPLELPWVRSSTNASVLVPATKLRISRPPGQSTLHFEVLTGFVSRDNVIQSSPDLLHWMNLSTNVPTGTTFTFEQPLNSGELALYYRAVVQD